MKEEDDKPIGLSLDELRSQYRKMQKVEVSTGILFVRPITVGVLERFAGKDTADRDPHELGKEVLGFLVSEEVDSDEYLSSELFEGLGDEDLQLLAHAAVALSGGAATAGCDGLIELVELLGKEREYLQEQRAVMANNVSALSFLSNDARESIQNSLLGVTSVSRLLGAASGLTNALGKASASDRLESELRGASVGSILDSPQSSYRRIDVPLIDYANTPAARAAKASEDSAERLENVAAGLAVLGEHVGKLADTMLTRAIPQWMARQQADRDDARTTIQTALKSLNWTRTAVIVALISTIVVTCIQLVITHSSSDEAVAQAQRNQEIWQGQFEEVKEVRRSLEAQLIAQQEQLVLLRELLKQQSLSVEREEEVEKLPPDSGGT